MVMMTCTHPEQPVMRQTYRRKRRAPFIPSRRPRSGAGRYTRLLEQNAALYAHSQRLSDWIQLLSHELRKPLTTISGGVELVLACEPDLSPTARDALAIVRAQSLRLGHLVAMILDEGVLSTGQPRLRLGPASLPSVVEAVLREQPPSRQANCAIPPDFPAIWADADALSHVLSQMLDHAFKYANGPLTVAAAVEGDHASVTITASFLGADSAGDDLAEAERQRSFDPLRLSDAPSLAVARALVEAMGGKIRVDTDERRGTNDERLLSSLVRPSSFVLHLIVPLADLIVGLPVE